MTVSDNSEDVRSILLPTVAVIVLILELSEYNEIHHFNPINPGEIHGVTSFMTL